MEDIVTDFEWCLIGYHHFYQRLPFMYRLLSFPVSTCYIKLIRSEIAATEKWRPTDRPPTLKNKQTNKQKKQNEKKKLGKKTRPDEKEKKGVEWSARHNDTGRPIPSAPINRPIDRSINRRVNGKSRRGVGRGLGRPGVCLRPECLPTYG